MTRREDLRRLYAILDSLARRTGGYRLLANCHGRQDWPSRGVYFFFEPGELRTTSGVGPRVVRVGTHAVSRGSRTSLWQRLSQHRGTTAGRGQHRASVFRLLVGSALIRRQGLDVPTWGVKGSQTAAARELDMPREALVRAEESWEQKVSAHIGAMPFLCLGIDDEPGPESLRAYVERRVIALLASSHMSGDDPASAEWLGRWSDGELVQASGLWNRKHVGEGYDSSFLDRLSHVVDGVRDGARSMSVPVPAPAGHRAIHPKALADDNMRTTADSYNRALQLPPPVSRALNALSAEDLRAAIRDLIAGLEPELQTRCYDALVERAACGVAESASGVPCKERVALGEELARHAAPTGGADPAGVGIVADRVDRGEAASPRASHCRR